MEVESNVIKDEPGRRSSAAVGQHSRRGSASSKSATSSNASASANNSVAVKVGLNMNMCRLCLAEGSTSSRLQPVYYSKDAPNESLLQTILDLTTIQVQYATDFPSSVCLGCKNKLEEYHLFRRQCIENDEILKLKYYEIKAAEEYHRGQHPQQVDDVKGEEYIDDGDDITLAIDESAEVEEYREEPDEQQFVQQDQVVEQQTIQYVAADGTMTEYVESEDVRTVSSASQQQQIHISGYSDADGIPTTEGHEIYYTDGTDTYAIHTTAEGYVNAANYVPQGYDNQTEIECTTIEHLPEEEVYMEEGGAGMGSIITPRGVHDRPYVCKHCKTSFKYEYNYERHMKNHAKILFRCGKCSKTFTKQRKCQQHFLKAHSSQRYECDICFRTYSLPTRLENHVIEMHSENGVYKCDRCSETFTSYLDFKSHRNSHHNINGSNATVIAQAVEQQSQSVPQSPQPRTATSISTRSSVSDSCDFEVMIDETKIQKPALGENCDEKRPVVVTAAVPGTEQDVILIDDEASNSTTSLVNNNNKPNTALKASSANNSIISGGTVVAAPNASIVPASNSATTVITNGIDKKSLHRQLLQQIEESEANSMGPKIYKCDNCTKTFVHLNNLKAHIYAEHDNDKPFKCKLCPISFKTKEILVMHMVLHSQHNTAS
ncbi:zinc finger protein 271-like [Toxorhynchites rutilus septentrionalis]|uniref:zinc finger protein 271-like n=1 Tax=Toxorhynchites rutilus septentrionalis TaxID=329112 RepID=UPI002479A18B|nr:zinc finger protein 271-like [Toxorhynchites rutilus septentrionalis]